MPVLHGETVTIFADIGAMSISSRKNNVSESKIKQKNKVKVIEKRFSILAIGSIVLTAVFLLHSYGFKNII